MEKFGIEEKAKAYDKAIEELRGLLDKVMKANTPEKIYVSNYSSGLTYNWHNKRLAVNDIEYTRTDAFVEKAKKWFEKQPETYDANGVRCYGMEDFDNFVKFMEGE